MSIAVERLFGVVRTTFEEGDEEFSSTSISIFSQVSGHAGYSAPRLAFDWLTLGGFSFGGAIGYQTDGEDGDDGDAWLLVARAGYFARPSAGFGIWPRAGITHIGYDDGVESTATALTLEVPLEFLFSRGIAISLTPHVDLGLSGESGDVDREITEIGLQFGVGAFF